MVPLAQYVSAARVQAFDKNVLLVAQDEFPQATNIDALKGLLVNPTHSCKCCGVKGHQVEACGFTSHVPGELTLPPTLDLPGG